MRACSPACAGGAWILAVGLIGCRGPGRVEERPDLSRAVVKVTGVAHAPILVAPGRVKAGSILRGWAEAAKGPVLVQALVREGRRPMGQATPGKSPWRRVQFAFPVPRDARGTVLVRAIDRQGLFTDQVVEITPFEGPGPPRAREGQEQGAGGAARPPGTGGVGRR